MAYISRRGEAILIVLDIAPYRRVIGYYKRDYPELEWMNDGFIQEVLKLLLQASYIDLYELPVTFRIASLYGEQVRQIALLLEPVISELETVLVETFDPPFHESIPIKSHQHGPLLVFSSRQQPFPNH